MDLRGEMLVGDLRSSIARHGIAIANKGSLAIFNSEIAR
jgi:hypothetical protein